MNRYDVSNSEGKFAGGSDGEVLADMMAEQAFFQPLDYESWTQHPEQYIAAIHAELNLNYEPMNL
ncbi:hypothetical protein [Providencia rettgeri]|uniref:hypothetical protein n=1 Tax=Providencia rettgeri TaxID=587 RepID=UPI0035243641